MAVLGTVLAPGFAGATSQPRDADSNAIMYNGAYSKTEWANKVKNGDTKNSAANLQKIYYNEGRGITSANFTASTTVDGTVFKDGHIEVNGKTVATGAKSVGREYMAGSTKSGSVWERPTSVSFSSISIPAWVSMEGGTFKYAIIKSCGNPVRATAVAKPTPSPTPKPTASPKPSPSPVQEFVCLDLTPSQPDKAKTPDIFRFTVESRVKNVTTTGYRFTASKDGGSSEVKDTDATTKYRDFTLTPGTWTVTAQVKTSAGISAINTACTATVHVNQASPSPTPSASPSPTPTKGGQVLSATLPATGPETLLGGVAGVTALGYASRAYLRSRKSVIDALRGKTNTK